MKGEGNNSSVSFTLGEYSDPIQAPPTYKFMDLGFGGDVRTDMIHGIPISELRMGLAQNCTRLNFSLRFGLGVFTL